MNTPNSDDDEQVTSFPPPAPAPVSFWQAFAVPFSVILALRAQSITARAAAGLLVLGSSYALAVTFSRAGYAGFTLALVIACLAAWLSRTPKTATNSGKDATSAPGELPRSPDPRTVRSRSYRWAASLI